MAIFRVCHDFSKYQPKWAGDYVRRFGPKNEGVEVDAPTKEEAIRSFATQHRLNPFYLTTK